MRRSYKVGRGLAEFEKLPADEDRSALFRRLTEPGGISQENGLDKGESGGGILHLF